MSPYSMVLVIPISLLIALIRRLLLRCLRLLQSFHVQRTTRRMRNVSASALRFAFQVCLPFAGDAQRTNSHTPSIWVWCVCVCVKNFLFMLTFHLNVSLFVCQFEVLKSRWLELGTGKWKRGNFDCNLCWVCGKEMPERRLHCCTCHWDSKGIRIY